MPGCLLVFDFVFQHTVGQHQAQPRKEAAPIKENTWIGSVIIGFMLCAVLVVLLILNPFAIDPVATCSVLAFVMGLWIVILFHKMINNRLTSG